ncbi:hypothetical protein [Marinibactrum halimedae]|uniref:Uncharacterized protein n=1 Tax=Marinibactrum halimedae TaxID=1444977 RepID=A0AA37T6N6_9GAMM|nr:hypothetical protein [Marinibactrum halimedae]MCD9459100.1 hypothetical protein [Marinibactrum halimedae]GLS24701.1 hypothetical protein GCM10007877_04150 [Marinibactrum halimedae]
MKSKILTYCFAFYDEQKSLLKIDINGGNDPAARYAIMEQEVSTNKIEALQRKIQEYWTFVDNKIKEGIVDIKDNERKRKIFFEDLKMFGGTIASLLLPKDVMTELWKHAAGSDIFCLATNMQWVPWESLYNPDTEQGEFLSDNCVISRIPTKTTMDTMQKCEEVSGRIICLDPVLNQDYTHEAAQTASAIFESKGEDVYLTDLIGDFTKKVSNKQLISWICEHEVDRGLRLCEDVHFTCDNCYTHRFPPGSVVFIMSCSTARADIKEEGYGARIVASSDCTVIAPSSIIAARAGIDFASRLIELARKQACSAVFELWTLLKRPLEGELADDGNITPEKCYALWFCIFGNCEASLESIQ